MIMTQSKLADELKEVVDGFHKIYSVFNSVYMDVAHASSSEEIEESLLFLFGQKDKLEPGQYLYLKEKLEELRDHFLTKEDEDGSES